MNHPSRNHCVALFCSKLKTQSRLQFNNLQHYYKLLTVVLAALTERLNFCRMGPSDVRRFCAPCSSVLMVRPRRMCQEPAAKSASVSTHTHTHARTLTHTQIHTRTLTHTFTHSLPHSHAHTHTHTLSLQPPPQCCLTTDHTLVLLSYTHTPSPEVSSCTFTYSNKLFITSQ